MGHASPTQWPRDAGRAYGAVAFGFVAGFAVATLVGLTVVVPMQRDVKRTHIDSDVHRGVLGAIEQIEAAAARDGCERTAAHLRDLAQRFDAYRQKQGPPPADWWQEIVPTTRGAR